MKISEISEFNKKVGIMIKKLRIASGLSRKKLAKMMNISQNQIQKYENGSDNINIVRLNYIAQIFKKNISYFFSEEVQEKNDFIFCKHQQICMKFMRNITKIHNKTVQRNIIDLINNLHKEDI